MREKTSGQRFPSKAAPTFTIPTPTIVVDQRELLRHRRIQEIIDRWCEELITGEFPGKRPGSAADPIVGIVSVTGWSAMHDCALAAMNGCGWKLTTKASKSAVGKRQKSVEVTFRWAPQTGPLVEAWP